MVAITRTASPQPYEVGRFYQVPCVRAVWLKMSFKPQWWPVLGPAHTDAEIIKFPYHHFHVDYRFLTKRQRQHADAHRVSSLNHTVFAYPITVSSVWPEGVTEEEFMARPERRELARGLIKGGVLPKMPPMDPTWYRTRRKRCSGEYPAYPPTTTWLRELEEAYKDSRLSESMVCPHRGADLSGFRPNDDGIVTCPLHGLKWHVRTGKLVREPQ